MQFIKEKRPSLVGKFAWVFTEASTEENEHPFCITATAEGICFTGDSPRLDTERELTIFAEVLSTAWKEHQKLKPKVVLETH